MRLGKCFVFIFLFMRCAVGEPVAKDYFKGSDKIAGGLPPSVPVVTYDTNAATFTFTASIDPDTGSEVTDYFVYFYKGFPTVYYQERDLVLIVQSTSKTFSINNITSGTYTVIVTGFDGHRESAITDDNKRSFLIP
ncbi:MAG: hypothetical protein LDLANPLL_02747 [Turneriella sp.]|nr:hypothetical protein [Turneriella sp.]